MNTTPVDLSSRVLVDALCASDRSKSLGRSAPCSDLLKPAVDDSSLPI